MLIAQPIHALVSSVGCYSFRDEMYRDIKSLGNNIQGTYRTGRNVQGRNIRGRIDLVPSLSGKEISS
jgi:hypothetical protein